MISKDFVDYLKENITDIPKFCIYDEFRDDKQMRSILVKTIKNNPLMTYSKNTTSRELILNVKITYGISVSEAMRVAQDICNFLQYKTKQTINGETFSIERVIGPVPVGRNANGNWEYILDVYLVCK